RKGRLEVTDIYGGHLTIAGPAVAEFAKQNSQIKVLLYRGSLKVASSEDETVAFQSAYANGVVSGEGAIWTSGESTQVLGLSGDVKAWHPYLAEAVTLVMPGYFAEFSPRFKHL